MSGHTLSPSFVVIGLAMVLLTSGCMQENDDLQAFVAEVKKRPARPIEPMPEVRPYEPFTYTAFDLRDPFAPPPMPQEPQSNNLQPDLERRKEPLERYPLDALAMMGVIEKDKRIFALIRSSDGTIHQVGVGHYAGQNFGRITHIQEDRVDLIEIIPDGSGGWIERPATIAMQEGPQGNQP